MTSSLVYPTLRSKPPPFGAVAGYGASYAPNGPGPAYLWVPGSAERAGGAVVTLAGASYAGLNGANCLAAVKNGFSPKYATSAGGNQVSVTTGTPGATFLVVLESFGGAAGSAYANLLSVGPTATSGGLGINTSNALLLRMGGTNQVSTLTVPSGPSVLIGGWTRSVAGYLYCNGAQYVVASTNFSQAATTVTSVGGVSGQSSITANIALAAVWNRLLTPDEFAALSDDPWQLFRPVQRRLYFGAAAGGNVGSAVGSSVVTGVEGYVARALGASVANGVPLTGSVGSAAGHSVAAAVEGYVARATGASSAQAVEGYVANAQGHSTATAIPFTGSVGSAVGRSTAQGVEGYVGGALGRSVAAALSPTSGSVGTATGKSVAQALCGSIASAVGQSIVDAPRAKGSAVARSLAEAVSLGQAVIPSLGLGPIVVPRTVLTQGDITPAMREWMVLVTQALSTQVSTLLSPVAAKGDLWGFSDMNARVPVGPPGTKLTADPTSPTGVSWQ